MFPVDGACTSRRRNIRPRALTLLFCTYALSAQPIPLEENAYRIHESTPHFIVENDSAHPFWAMQNFSIGLYNSSYLSNGGYLEPNRFILHLQDSLAYKFLDLTFRVRIDQGGEGVTDASWEHDSLDGLILDIEKLNLVITPHKAVQIGLGKDRFNWGPVELGGLLVSNYNEGMIALQQRYSFGPLVLRGIATQLNSVTQHDSLTDDSSYIKRYFSAAKLEYYRPKWGVALGQSVIYSGEGRSYELGYILPFMPYHFVQLADQEYGNNGANTFVSGDAYGRLFDEQMEIYGELLVDDFQASGDSTSKTIQNALAFMAGVRFRTHTNLYGFFEAGQINSYVYNHMAGMPLRYLHNESLLGSPLGPDQQLFWGEVGYVIGSIVSVDLTGWYRRSGERTVLTDYSYYTNAQNSRTDPIPSGEVQEEIASWLTAKIHHKGVEASLVGGFAHYINENHTQSQSSYPFVGITLKSGIQWQWKGETP